MENHKKSMVDHSVEKMAILTIAILSCRIKKERNEIEDDPFHPHQIGNYILEGKQVYIYVVET